MLYNRYRPGRFSDVVGQPAAIVLRNFSYRTPPHSILLSGTRGVGKTTLARIFSLAINCRSKKRKPCGKCDSCLMSRNHPDIFEVDSTVNGNPASVEKLTLSMYHIPKFRYRVFIFDEAHTITQKGMSILLKAIEEPSSTTVVILLTTEPDKIDQALRSRCMWLSLKAISKFEIMRLMAGVCKQEQIKISKDALSYIAGVARGSAREALSMLELIAASDKPVSKQRAERRLGSRVDCSRLMEILETGQSADCIDEIDRLCLYHEPKSVCESVIDETADRLRSRLSNNMNVSHFMKWLDIFKAAKRDMANATNPITSLEIASVECSLITGGVPSSVIVLKDWEAFVENVRDRSQKLASVAKSMKFVRVKKDDIVICKSSIKLDEESIRKIELIAKKVSNNKNLKLEVLRV